MTVSDTDKIMRMFCLMEGRAHVVGTKCLLCEQDPLWLMKREAVMRSVFFVPDVVRYVVDIYPECS